MDVEVIRREQMILVGAVVVGNKVGDINICEAWERFESQTKDIKHRIDGTAYEIHLHDDFSPRKHYCFIGVEVSEIADVPLGLFLKVVPECDFAVYTHCFGDGGFDHAYRQIEAWFDGSQFTLAHDFDIQCYDERFHGIDNPESIVAIHTPVARKG